MGVMYYEGSEITISCHMKEIGMTFVIRHSHVLYNRKTYYAKIQLYTETIKTNLHVLTYNSRYGCKH